MRIYLAGPMRGIPEFNFPAFRRATTALREQGHTVFSPAEEEEVQFGDFTRGTSGDLSEIPQFNIRDALKSDCSWICDHAEAVALLPGWEGSKGAIMEKALAEAIGIEVLYL